MPIPPCPRLFLLRAAVAHELPPGGALPSTPSTAHPKPPARPSRDSSCCSSLRLNPQNTSLQNCSLGCVRAHVSIQVWRGYLQRKRTMQDRQTDGVHWHGESLPGHRPGPWLASAGGPSLFICCSPTPRCSLHSPSLPLTPPPLATVVGVSGGGRLGPFPPPPYSPQEDLRCGVG